MRLAIASAVSLAIFATCTPTSRPRPVAPPWGGLEVHQRGAPLQSARFAVVLLHGYGAPGTDLVGLEQDLGRLEGVTFLYPEAPIDMGPGRAWWPLGQWRARREAGEDLSDVEPPGMEQSRQQLLRLLADLRSRGIPAARTMVGGFSQGAMLALDTVLSADERHAGVAVLSGTLVAKTRWRNRARAKAPMRAFVSHGRADPLLSFDSAMAMQDLLSDSGWRTEVLSFEGGHAIPRQVRQRLGDFIRTLL